MRIIFVQPEFTEDDMEALSTVLLALVHVPVITDSELGYILAGHYFSYLLTCYLFLAIK